MPKFSSQGGFSDVNLSRTLLPDIVVVKFVASGKPALASRGRKAYQHLCIREE
jgi:hypothetical protein